MKKAISLMLVIMLILSFIVSCTEKSTDEQSKEASEESATVTSAETTDETNTESSFETTEEISEETTEGPNATPVIYYDSEYYSAEHCDELTIFDKINLNEKQNIKAWLDGKSDKTIKVYQRNEENGGGKTIEVPLNQQETIETAREFFVEHPLPELYIDGVAQNGQRSFYIEYDKLQYECCNIAISDMYVSLTAYRYHEMPLSEVEKDFFDALPTIVEYGTQPMFIDGEGFKKFEFNFFDRKLNKAVSQKAMYDLSDGNIAIYFTYGAYIIKLSSASPFHLSEAFKKIEIGNMDYSGDNTAYMLKNEYNGAVCGSNDQFQDISISFNGLEDVKTWVNGESDILLVDGPTENKKTKTVYESKIVEKARSYITENGLPYLKYDTQLPEYNKIYMSFSNDCFSIYCNTEYYGTSFLAEHRYDIPYDVNNVYEYLLKINEKYGYKYIETYDWYGSAPKILSATFTDESEKDLKYDIIYSCSIIPCDLAYDMFCFVHKGYVIQATVYDSRYDGAEVIDAKHMVFDDILKYSNNSSDIK